MKQCVSRRSTLASIAAVVLSLIVGIAPVFALFSNGGFEGGDFTGWTKATFLNPGLTGSSPFTGSSINRQAGGVDRTAVVGGPGVQPLSQNDPVVGAALQYPRFGSYAARVGDTTASNNANSLSQQSTVAAGDVDPSDSLVHVRFAYAPVLQNPGHSEDEQPFFYIAVRNVTRGNAIIYENFNFSGQAGVPWKNVGSVQYTDWQLVDIAPGSSALQVGDTIQIEVVAAGCSLGGHYGYVYVDGFGADVPSPRVTASAPAQVNAGQTLTYAFNYSNPTGSTINNVVLTENLPAQTTFASVSDPTNCSIANGVVTCAIGTLAAGASGTIQVTVNVNVGATGSITNGNYSIGATGYAPLLGPPVTTSVTPAPVADLYVTNTDNQSSATTGSPVTYTFVVGNNGPTSVTGAAVNYAVSNQLTNVTWTCVAAGGATCPSSGTGSINQAIDLPSGATATYTIQGTVSPSASGTLDNTATVSPPAGINDSTPANNSATDSNTVDVDTTPPAQPVVTSPSLTSNTKPSLFGTAEANSTVRVSIDLDGDGTPDVTYTTTANGSGNWSIDTATATPTSGTFPANGLSDAAYNISATATDATGNVSVPGTQTLTVDTTAPTVSITSAEASYNRLPLVSGMAEPNNQVAVAIDLGNGASVTYQVTANASGMWAITESTPVQNGALPAGGLADGVYNVSAIATDGAGNSSSTATDALLVDRTAPDAPLIGSANLTDDRTPLFFGTAEPGSTLTLTVTLPNNTALVYTTPVDQNGQWQVDTATAVSSGASLPAGGLVDGTYAVTAQVEDTFNNQSPITNQSLEIDATAPTPPTITSNAITSERTPIISGGAEPNATVRLTIDLGGGASVTYSVVASGAGVWSVDTSTAVPVDGTFPVGGLADNNYPLSADARDATNNVSAPASQLLTVDTTLPTVKFTSPETTNDRTPVIAGTSEPGSTVTLVLTLADGTQVTYTTVAAQPSGAWSVDTGSDVPTSGTFPSEGLDDGPYAMSASATDTANNTGPDTNQTLTIDTVIPTVSINPLVATKDRTPLLTGTAEPNTVVTVMIDLNNGTSLMYEVRADAQGTWSIDVGTLSPISGELPKGGLVPDNYNVTAISRDLAGNASLPDTKVLPIEKAGLSAPVITSEIITGNRTPIISGTGVVGTYVKVELDLDGDGIPDVTYIVPVDQNGLWSVNTATDTPTSGTFPADGIQIGSNVGIWASTLDQFDNLSDSATTSLVVKYVTLLVKIVKP